jgi:acetoin utilization deacetylase AcuC-like enzyme
MSSTLAVFFSPAMVARAGSFSPSAEKPAAVVASWLARGLPVELHDPVAATLDDFALAHDRDHVRAILEGRACNGFGNRSPEVAASLPFTTGAMLSAARHAIAARTIACAPCSGFHHAGPKSVEGFCTFNGLMVTALALLRDGTAKRVGIVDCDMHFGNGTEAILDRSGARDRVKHFTAGARYHHADQASAFFAELPRVLDAMADCDVVLYQAGADPHVDDPLGGFLTTDELRRRDEVVFSTLSGMGVPVAWNLAGGYRREKDGSIPGVLEVHENTTREHLRAVR